MQRKYVTLCKQRICNAQEGTLCICIYTYSVFHGAISWHYEDYRSGESTMYIGDGTKYVVNEACVSVAIEVVSQTKHLAYQGPHK